MRSLLGAILARPEPSTEKRALTAFGPWPGSGTSAAGVTVNNSTAMALSAVWACQTLIADAIAGLPIDVYRKVGENRVEVPAPRWLTNPNPDSSLIDFEIQRMLSLLGWGNCYLFLIRQNGMPAPAPITERWVLDPARVVVKREKNRVAYYVDGRPTRPGDIQHIKGYCPPGQVVGMSPIQEHVQGIGLGLAAEKFGAKFLEYGSNASGVLEVPALPEDADDQVIAMLQQQFQGRHGGVDNMHRPIVLTAGTTWTQTSVNPEDSQLLETRQFQVAEIARIYRVPPHMIGDVERSTSWGEGIEAQKIQFYEMCLLAWVNRVEEADTALLAAPRFVKRNVNALLRGDTEARAAWYTAGLEGGWIKKEEIRVKEDLPPLDDDEADPGAEGGGDGPQQEG